MIILAAGARVGPRIFGSLLSNIRRTEQVGLAWKNLGEPRKAGGFYEQQLVIAHAIGDRRSEANASFSLAVVLESLGDPATARGQMQQALALYESMESPRAETARAWLARHP